MSRPVHRLLLPLGLCITDPETTRRNAGAVEGLGPPHPLLRRQLCSGRGAAYLAPWCPHVATPFPPPDPLEGRRPPRRLPHKGSPTTGSQRKRQPSLRGMMRLQSTVGVEPDGSVRHNRVTKLWRGVGRPLRRRGNQIRRDQPHTPPTRGGVARRRRNQHPAAARATALSAPGLPPRQRLRGLVFGSETLVFVQHPGS